MIERYTREEMGQHWTQEALRPVVGLELRPRHQEFLPPTSGATPNREM